MADIPFFKVASHPILHTIFVSTRNFVRARQRNNIFALLPYLPEKRKAIELPFCTKEIGKEKTRKLFWQGLGWQKPGILAKVVKDTQQQINRVVHMDQKAICILSCPVYYLTVILRRQILNHIAKVFYSGRFLAELRGPPSGATYSYRKKSKPMRWFSHGYHG